MTGYTSRRMLRSLARRLIRRAGYDLVPYPPRLPDASEEDRAILRQVAPFTMTSPARQLALLHSVRYLVQARRPGAFVESGVWRGGSMMAVALALQQSGDTTRDLYLYDTFSGMPAPSAHDVRNDGRPAAALAPERQDWCAASLDEVRANLAGTGYPAERLHYIAGQVETLLPEQAPAGPIACLRLDTDWYASTLAELTHLYPRVVSGGIVILDDYGHWQGARAAVDEYFAGQSIFLHRIDYTGRLLIKP